MALFYIFSDSAHMSRRDSEKRCQIVQRHLLHQLRFGSNQLIIALLGGHREQIDTIIINQADLFFDEIVVELMKSVVG